jgi:type IV pilus assembly protein PilA
MLERIWKMHKDEDGFTLIELMVVVLIIAILIAIAIPTFLGLRERAQNRAATSDLRNGLTAAKAFFTDGDSYTGFDNVDGEDIEPSLNWVGNVAPAEGEVAVRVAADDDLMLTTLSASGDYRCLGEENGTTIRGDDNAAAATAAACAGTF